MTLADQLHKILWSSRRNNTKLGKGCLSWSLPPRVTCPGSTMFCRKYCYTRRMQYPSCVKAWSRNLELAKDRGFPKALREALSRLPECLLRVHVSGDFFSIRYVEAWKEALDEHDHIHAWAYTRVWRREKLWDAIFGGGVLWPDWLWASEDPNTGWSPITIPRRAIMLPTTVTCPWHTNPDVDNSIPICQHQTRGVSCAECGWCSGWAKVGGVYVKTPRPRELQFLRH